MATIGFQAGARDTARAEPCAAGAVGGDVAVQHANVSGSAAARDSASPASALAGLTIAKAADALGSDDVGVMDSAFDV